MFDTENTLQQVLEFWAKDDYFNAYRTLDLMLDACPENVEALSLKGHILDMQALSQDSGQELLFERAKRCYEKILDLLPDHPQTAIDMGDYWMRKKKYKNALKYYNKAIWLLRGEAFDSSMEDDLKDIYNEKLLILAETGNCDEYKK